MVVSPPPYSSLGLDTVAWKDITPGGGESGPKNWETPRPFEKKSRTLSLFFLEEKNDWCPRLQTRKRKGLRKEAPVIKVFHAGVGGSKGGLPCYTIRRQAISKFMRSTSFLSPRQTCLTVCSSITEVRGRSATGFFFRSGHCNRMTSNWRAFDCKCGFAYLIP